MSLAKDLESVNEGWRGDEWEAITCPPTDLYSDEPPLESEWHLRQILLLVACLEWLWRDRQDFYCAGNLTVYYNESQLKVRDFRGPDFFVVLDTVRKPRKSWVVWDEGGKYPNVIIELLSSTTARVDRGEKKDLFQNTFRTPEYFWFDPQTGAEFRGFQLVNGHYQDIPPNEQGWLWSQQLNLYLGVLEGRLRFFSPEGQLIPTPEEVAIAEQQRAVKAEALLARYRKQFGELSE
ncbi:MAG: Uma2 family endonuclease [Oscillatoriales cyanobacterium C42_A2020_001]|nr:Uma2 family endonuclease [Leptolyngbyaceae cyanobacterium C42_A2020_001]